MAPTCSRCDAPSEFKLPPAFAAFKLFCRPFVAAITRRVRLSTVAHSGAGSDHPVTRTQGACQRPPDHAAFAIVIPASSACDEVTEPKIPPCALTIFSPHSSNSGK
jgi:hypothetical protein